MASVLLIRPLCGESELEFAEPLGIERLAAYLQENGGHEVRLFDRRLYEAERRAGRQGHQERDGLAMCGEPAGTPAKRAAGGFFDALKAVYAESAPDLVGCSLMTSSDVPDALRIMSRLKAWWPESTFVAGGIYVTTDPESAARRLPRHVVLLQGEGEAKLLALANGCAGERCALLANGLPVEAPTLADQVDLPDGAWVDPDRWARPLRADLERYARLGCAVNVQSSRGCAGSCAFCATPSLPKELRRWRPRNLELVLDELEVEARRLEACALPPVFNFVDDDFGPFKRLELLAEGLRERQLRIAYACELRFSSLASQTGLAARLEGLHQSGLTRVFFGLESLNPDTLCAWGKPLQLEKLPSVLDACRRADVHAQVGYILWHSSQTIQGARDEVEQLHDLGIYSHKTALSRLIVFPGCALAADGADEHGCAPLEPHAEAFCRQFANAAAELTQAWTKAAVALPYAASAAHLGWDVERRMRIERAIEQLDARSFELFMNLSEQFVRQQGSEGGGA